MKPLISILMAIALLISCNDSEPEVSGPTQSIPSGQLEVSVRSCATPDCDEPLSMEGLEVNLYGSMEDALLKTRVLYTSFTDDKGSIRHPALEIQELFIRIDHTDHGVYISSETIMENSISYNFVDFVQGYHYSENDIASLKQKQISLETPTVGQSSEYIFHLHHNFINFNIPDHTENRLQVSILEKLEDNSYLIEESIDSIYQFMLWGQYPQEKTIRNVWKFESDSLHILPYSAEYFGSFVWNLIADPVDRESFGWAFPLERPADNRIDMENDIVSLSSPGWGSGYAEDYEILGNLYTDLITETINYTGWDGPLKVRVYNLKYGPIRSLNFFGGMSSSTMGFDLVLI